MSSKWELDINKLKDEARSHLKDIIQYGLVEYEEELAKGRANPTYNIKARKCKKINLELSPEATGLYEMLSWATTGDAKGLIEQALLLLASRYGVLNEDGPCAELFNKEDSSIAGNQLVQYLAENKDLRRAVEGFYGFSPRTHGFQ